MASRLIAHYLTTEKERGVAGNTTIRNYHAERNEVFDKASGLRMEYSEVVGKGNLGAMIEARRTAVGSGS
jgi:uncharacterized coiled-coil DUF342 family protein